METVIAKLRDTAADKPADPQFFRMMGSAFKLIPPPHPGDKRFRPDGVVQIPLNAPKDVMAAPPEPPPVPVPVLPKAPELPRVVAEPQKVPDDAQVLARIERMIRAERRSRDLEEENRVLTRTIARLQSEIDRLKETAK